MRPSFWSFKKARAFIRKQGLRTTIEWHTYSRSGNMPVTIPRSPQQVYSNQGWAGFRDWLIDTRHLVKGRYLSFRRARTFARTLALKQVSDWPTYAASSDKPDEIPSCPEQVYADFGWVDYYDWLGLGKKPSVEYLSYEAAKQYVHQLKLKDKAAWLAYANSNKRPNNIPKYPYDVYRDKGYKGMGDWLNSGYLDARMIQYRPFTKARAWVRKQKIKTVDEWLSFARSNQLPHDIPRTPNIVYKDQWKSYPDWLGNKGSPKPTYRPERNVKINRDFKSARAFVRRLNLKTGIEWKDYTRSGACPLDIPSYPNRVYSEWISMADWLGTSKQYKRFSSN